MTLKTLFSQSPETYDNISKAGGFESYRNKLSYDMEIDAVYILGNFGVELKGETSGAAERALRFSGTFSICPTRKADCRRACYSEAALL